MDGQSSPPGAAVDQMHWMTVTNLVLIAIAIVVVIAAIWWGSRLRARRRIAEREIAARQGVLSADPAPAAEAPAPVAADAAAPVEEALAAVAPPLADVAVAATAFDAAPAAQAIDLATPPEPPASNDDFTRMKGVGPKLAARLRELGVVRYDQLATLSPDEAEALDAKLGAFKGRLGRDRWIEQAGYLARGDREGFEAAFGKL